jgi:saccharopine dehydrogenase-like NADP-dependent oxidoreductase
MKVLLVVVGGVGESIAVMAARKPWLETMVLADYKEARAKEVQDKINDPKRLPVEFVDAGKQEMIEALAKKYQVDLIMNACDPSFNIPIFDAAYNAGCNYMDMAMTLSEPHPETPYKTPGVKLGD